MSAPDVYEELVAMAADARIGTSEYDHGEAVAFERATKVVEFLRWRDAREEWPAEGCQCLCVFQWAVSKGYHARRADAMERAYVTRWRYILGPCGCKP